MMKQSPSMVLHPVTGERCFLVPEADYEVLTAKETCSTCKKDFSPSLIESGQCIFCVCKELKKQKNSLHKMLCEIQLNIETYEQRQPNSL